MAKSKERKGYEEVVRLYLEGYPTGKIAKMLNKSEFEVVRILERAGWMRAK